MASNNYNSTRQGAKFSPVQQLHFDPTSGKYSLVSTIIPKSNGLDREANSIGRQPTQFHQGLSGFYNYQDRLKASHRTNNQAISAHEKISPEVLTRPPPETVIGKSLVGIEKYVLPNIYGAPTSRKEQKYSKLKPKIRDAKGTLASNKLATARLGQVAAKKQFSGPTHQSKARQRAGGAYDTTGSATGVISSKTSRPANQERLNTHTSKPSPRPYGLGSKDQHNSVKTLREHREQPYGRGFQESSYPSLPTSSIGHLQPMNQSSNSANYNSITFIPSLDLLERNYTGTFNRNSKEFTQEMKDLKKLQMKAKQTANNTTRIVRSPSPSYSDLEKKKKCLQKIQQIITKQKKRKNDRLWEISKLQADSQQKRMSSVESSRNSSMSPPPQNAYASRQSDFSRQFDKDSARNQAMSRNLSNQQYSQSREGTFGASSQAPSLFQVNRQSHQPSMAKMLTSKDFTSGSNLDSKAIKRQAQLPHDRAHNQQNMNLNSQRQFTNNSAVEVSTGLPESISRKNVKTTQNGKRIKNNGSTRVMAIKEPSQTKRDEISTYDLNSAVVSQPAKVTWEMGGSRGNSSPRPLRGDNFMQIYKDNRQRCRMKNFGLKIGYEGQPVGFHQQLLKKEVSSSRRGGKDSHRISPSSQPNEATAEKGQPSLAPSAPAIRSKQFMIDRSRLGEFSHSLGTTEGSPSRSSSSSHLSMDSQEVRMRQERMKKGELIYKDYTSSIQKRRVVI